MSEVVVVALTIVAVWVLTIVITALLVRAHLRRQNRVARATPSPAPVRWLWSPSAPARLHRRLQTAVWPIDPATGASALPVGTTTDELRLGLVEHATSLDTHLAAMRRAPRPIRRAAVRDADGHVRLIEDLSARLEARPPSPPTPRPWVALRPTHTPLPPPPSLAELRERILQLEAARAEVARVEAARIAPPVPAAQPASEVDTVASVSSATLARPSSSA
jgi:hypothetical protein